MFFIHLGITMCPYETCCITFRKERFKQLKSSEPRGRRSQDVQKLPESLQASTNSVCITCLSMNAGAYMYTVYIYICIYTGKRQTHAELMPGSKFDSKRTNQKHNLIATFISTLTRPVEGYS